jgi:hypothetical protein
MRAHEVSPARLLASLWGGTDNKAAWDIAYGLIPDAIAEIVQCADDSIVSPVAILTSDANGIAEFPTIWARPIEAAHQPT